MMPLMAGWPVAHAIAPQSARSWLTSPWASGYPRTLKTQCSFGDFDTRIQRSAAPVPAVRSRAPLRPGTNEKPTAAIGELSDAAHAYSALSSRVKLDAEIATLV